MLRLTPRQYSTYSTALKRYGAKPYRKGLARQEAALMKMIAAMERVK